ncbi:MAG: NAD(P)/FAD-dependent oxidoreductase [Rhodocyclales bacterium]|nr:NAD(P)/FAD-dependent oxidoreductase [Rhodocyclales bacterium]
MSRTRREFLVSLAAMAMAGSGRAGPPVAGPPPELLPRTKGRRVVVVGGGWGGLSCARHLRKLAPDLDVVLLEKNAAFWSCPLSNKWLAGLVDTRYLIHDYAAAARAYGYTFVQAEVQAIDRERRRVVTAGGTVYYDWLVLAVGIRQDYGVWFGKDRGAIDQARSNYPSAWQSGREAEVLKRKLASFAGGDFVMNLPPMPYRCPPAPYERASLIAWWFKTRKIKARLIVLDPNPISPHFRRIFAERYRDWIVHVPNAQVTAVDPFKKVVSTEFDEYRFDDAILMPPQQAGELVWQAGLIGHDSDGRPTGWAAQDPLRLQASDDRRVFLVGDALGPVSPLFGHYPKSGHAASRQGRIVAGQIAALANGAEPPRELPESVCFVFPDFEPQEMLRIESRYRLRGDGLIEQASRQHFDPNPRGEDVEWATSMFGDFLGFKG